MDELHPATRSSRASRTRASASDAPAWCRQNGHELLDIKPEGPGIVARIRKGGAVAGAGGAT